MTDKIELSKWTHDGDKVLIVKCADKKGKTYEGFEWPDNGTVSVAKWKPTTQCDETGLYGWAWGIGIGEGKEPIWNGRWYVLAADPNDVIANAGGGIKVKFRSCEVISRGSYNDAMQATIAGRIAWVEQNSSGSASASGDSGSASATGYSGSASASGSSGSASASGDSGSASASGDSGSVCASGEYCKVQTRTGAIAVCARCIHWTAFRESVLVQWWRDDEKKSCHKMFDPKRLKLEDGQKVYIQDGKIVTEWR